MKILVIGASGTIGKAVASELALRHEVVTAGRTSGDHRVDIANPQSLRDLYAKQGQSTQSRVPPAASISDRSTP